MTPSLAVHWEVAPLHSVLFMACHSAVNSLVSFLIWSLHLFSGLPLFHCPLKSCLNACLMTLSFAYGKHNKQSSVSDDIGHRFRANGALSDLDIL